MKRIIALIMASVLLLAVFSGCAGKQGSSDVQSTTKKETAGQTTQKEPAAKTEAPMKSVELRLWTHYESHQELIQSIIDEFSEKNPHIKISNEFVPFSDVKKQLSVGLAADQLPDIVVIDNPDMAAFAAMGVFADITEYFKDWPAKDQYFAGPWKSCMYEGKLHGIPIGSNCLALFYNVDMLNEAGVEPPTTWDELKDAAKKLTRDGVKGLAISAPNTEEGTFQFIPWLLSTGATVEKVDTPEAIKAFAFLGDLVNEGLMSKEVINWTQSDVNKQFMAGNVAMMLNGPWQLPTIARDAPDLNFAITLTPKDKQYSSVLGGENWGVVARENVEASVEFVKYLAEPEVLKSYITNFGYIPSRKDVASDPMFTDDPNLKIFVDQLQYAMPRGPSPKWPQISQALSTALQEVLTQSKTPEQAAKDAQAKIDEVLK
jgi:multiple sugar transport system substrate-binding protein